jgi:hypothetical protein
MAANNPSRIHTRHSHPHPYHHRFVIASSYQRSNLTMVANNPSCIHARHSHPHPHHHRFVIASIPPGAPEKTGMTGWNLMINKKKRRHREERSDLRTMPINTPITFVAVMPPALPLVNLSPGRETHQKLRVDYQLLKITSLRTQVRSEAIPLWQPIAQLYIRARHYTNALTLISKLSPTIQK